MKSKLFSIFVGLFLAALSASALAQTSTLPITSLPQASLPLTGSEQTVVVQGGATRRATIDSFRPTTMPFTQSGTGAATRTVDARLKDTVHAADFSGVDPTGATDSRAGLQNALDSNPSAPVYVGPGTYRLDGMLTVNNGQILQCASRVETYFKIDSTTFNMASLGVIRLGTGEPGGQIFDCGFQFAQPDSNVRANIIQYPPAIYAAAAPRFIIDRVRIERAWTCLNATGNSGGANIGLIECGAFSNSGAINFNGSLDFIHISHIHCWPFGISGVLPNAANVYIDQTTNCFTAGRVDGLEIDGLSAYKTNVRFTSAAGGTSIPYLIDNLQLDLEGADLIVEAAGNTHLNVAKTYSTKGAAQVGPSYDIQGGNVTFGEIEMPIDLAEVCQIKASGSAVVQVNSGRLTHTDPDSAAACAVDTSALKLFNIRAGIPSSNRTVAFFDSTSSGSMQLVNIAGRNNGSGFTGNAYSFSTDTQFNRVEGVSFPNWAHNLPFTTSLGYYDLEEYDAVTVAPTFATMGDFVAANVAFTNSKLKRSGNFVDLMVVGTFGTNAYTTAAGAFTLALTTGGIGIPTAAQATTPCYLGTQGVFASGASMWTASITTSSLAIWALNTGVAPAQFTVANVPASTAGFAVNVQCRYRVR
jgi:hypothetical protein